MADEMLACMRPMPIAKKARAVTGLPQSGFCARYGIPLTCQRDWEQGRSDPPEATASYLRAIRNDAEAVAAAFDKAA